MGKSIRRVYRPEAFGVWMMQVNQSGIGVLF
jgi:hypothetical protein